MFTRAVAFALLFVLAGSLTALASASEPPSATPGRLSAAVARAAANQPVNLWTLSQQPKRPAMLPVLYGTYVTLQAVDIVSTRRAITAGARESNPLMNGGHVGTMIAMKAATGASTMYIAEKMWKKNRLGAVVMMAAINGATAAIVAHNTRNLRR